MLAANSASFGSAGTADFNGHTVNQEMEFLSDNGIGETLLQFLGRSLNQNTVHDVPDVTGFEAVFNNKIFLRVLQYRNRNLFYIVLSSICIETRVSSIEHGFSTSPRKY